MGDISCDHEIKWQKRYDLDGSALIEGYCPKCGSTFDHTTDENIGELE